MGGKSARLIDHSDQARGKAPSLLIDEDAFEGVKTWIDKVTDDAGRAGYQTRLKGLGREFVNVACYFPSRNHIYCFSDLERLEAMRERSRAFGKADAAPTLAGIISRVGERR